MVAGADRDAFAVEHRSDVVRVDAIEDEGENPCLVPRRPDDAQARNCRERLRRVGQQVPLVRLDRGKAQGRDVVERRAEGDSARDVRRAGLELVGQVVERRLLEGDGADHVAAALVRRHRLEERRLSVEHADARRTVDLVARERVEVAVEGPHVDGHPRRRLRAVDEDHRPAGVGELRDLPDRQDRAEGVREVRDRDDLRPVREHLLEGRDVHVAGVVERRHDEARALLLAEELPGDDIRMVLEARDQDLVARADVPAAVRLRDEVDGLGRSADEDDLVRRGGVDERPRLLARRVVGVGRVDREPVNAAVDVGVAGLVDAALGVDHRRRLLGGGRIVEVDEGLAVDLRREDGKVAADGLDVVGGGGRIRAGLLQDGAHSGPPDPGRRRPSSRSTRCRTSGTRIFSATSAAKAQVSSASASASPIPRERR